MLKEDLKALHQKQDDPCVSIIIPTHRVSAHSDVDYIRLKNAIKRATESLHEQYDKEKVAPLIDRMEALLERDLDYSNLLEGLGLFISSNMEKVVHLPFEVDEKVIVDTSFEVRDLMLSLNRELDYYLLLLSEDHIRFFEGKGRNLIEIKDDNFPDHHDKNEFEYQKAHFVNPGTGSLQGTTEKPNEEQKKVQEHLKHVDNKLSQYLTNQNPLFLVGDKQMLGDFETVTHFRENIQGKIAGNFQHLAKHELADKIHTEVKRYIHEQQERALRLLEEEVGYDRVTSGLSKIYRDAFEGKGAILLVEEGYSEPAYLDKSNYQLYLTPEKTDGLKRLDDAVDDIIEEVLDKNGEVRFVENGKLEKYGRMAMILRFNE